MSFDKWIEGEQYQQLVVVTMGGVNEWMHQNIIRGAETPFLIEKSVVEGLISVLADCEFKSKLEKMVAAVNWDKDKIYYF